MEMTWYSIKPRTRKYFNKAGEVVHKAGEYLGNKIADVITKSNDVNTEKQQPVEEIIILPEKREEILSKLSKVF